MDKMKIYEAALSYHATGKLVEGAEQDVKNAPFDGAKPARKDGYKDRYGNKVKHVAKHLAKKGQKQAMSEEEILEILDDLETVYEAAIDLQDILEDVGVDLEELFSLDEDAEDIEENFANMSKTKRLIALRKSGRSKHLNRNSRVKRRGVKKAQSIQPKR